MELATKLYDITEVQLSLMNSMTSGLVEDFMQHGFTKPQAFTLANEIMDRLKWDELKEELVKLYDNGMNEDEIKILIKFYEENPELNIAFRKMASVLSQPQNISIFRGLVQEAMVLTREEKPELFKE